LGSDLINRNLANQLVRSGTSLGANYREANETETKKDFQFRVRICRKEAKETMYWITLIMEANPQISHRLEDLLAETGELVKIFAAIVEKSKNN
jgi:four helix bundle protein